MNKSLCRQCAIQRPGSLRTQLGRQKSLPSSGVRSRALVFSAVSVAALAAGAVSSELAAQTTNDRSLDKIEIEEERASPGENPFANPDAAYQIQRSSSVKRVRKLQQTPKSITVVPKEILKDSGATSMRDVMRSQPGITLGTGEGGNAYGDRFIIRGFEARNDVYVDGLRDPGVTSRATFAVEQLEISRGPDSSFAGRGTSGGAVNSVTKMPGDDNFLEIDGTLGAPGSARAAIDFNRLLNDDFSVRINVEAAHEEVAGRDEAYDRRNGLAFALKYQPRETMALTFDHYALRTSSMPDWGIPWNVAKSEPYPYPDNFYGITERDFWNTEANISTLKFEYEFTPKVRWSTQARIGRTRNAYVTTKPDCHEGGGPDVCATQGQVLARTATRDQSNEYMGVASNLIVEHATGGVRHTIVTGLEVTREEFVNRRPIVANPGGRTPIQDLISPTPNQAWQGSVYLNDDSNRDVIKSASVWLMDTAKLNSTWDVFGGLRWDNYQIDGATLDSEYVASQENHYQASFVNWHLGVVRELGDNGRIYASFTSSSNPPGEQTDASSAAYGGLDTTVSSLKPERNQSVELGTKWELFDEKLALNAAVFKTVKTDAIIAAGGGQPSSQVGEISVQGIEFGMSGGWHKTSLYGGLTLLKSEILGSSDAAEVGGKLPNTAHASAYLRAKYQFSRNFSLGGAVVYTGPVYGGTPNRAANDNRLPAWTRLDLNGDYKLSKRFTLRANVTNLTDKRYYDALYRSDTPFVYVAPGRSIALTIVYRSR